jgi:N-hydroxyarylamine O-acetyltransferase
LQRIEFYEAISVSSQVLKKLHLAFVTHIPFETLDIFWKRRFSLSLLDLYKKVVIQQRGGYCYELNGLFYYLLQGLSFDVSICNAQLYDSRGLIIPRSQHMVLVVELENPWLVDVGYGNGFLEPLLIESSQTQKQGDRFYQCIRQGSRYVIEEMSSGIWQPWYAFTKESKQMSDFEDRNYFHQTSRESIFFEKRISMIMQEDETVELKGNQLTRKTSAGTFITMIEEEKILELLQREFGIKISTV